MIEKTLHAITITITITTSEQGKCQMRTSHSNLEGAARAAGRFFDNGGELDLVSLAQTVIGR